jgi:hypothetical protein
MTRSPPPDESDRNGIVSKGVATRTLAAVTLAALLLAAAVSAPAAARSDGDAVAVASGPIESTANATVAGTSTLDPGTALQVRIRADGDTEPAFLRSTTVTVGPDGAWNATVDLAAVETHGRISVTVSAVDGDAEGTKTLSLRDDTAGSATDDRAPVSTPGFGAVVAVVAIAGSAAALAGGRRLR